MAVISAPQTRSKRRAVDDAGDDGDATDAARDGDPAHLREAYEWLGTSEATPKGRSNDAVIQMFADAGHPEIRDALHTPWCSAFAGACHERTGTPTRRSLMARSWLQWGEPTDNPRRGDIVVMWRGARNDGNTGHVFFWLSATRTHVVGIGGNQGDAVSIAKFPRSRVLGYRRARPIAKSGIVRAQAGQALLATTGGGAVVAGTLSETAAPQPKVETVMQAADNAKSILERIQEALPASSKWHLYVAAGAAVLTVGLAVWTMRRRAADYREHGT